MDWLQMKRVMQRAGPYPVEAYQFIREGLAHTAKAVHGDRAGDAELPEESRHISGQQLCLGLRDYAIKRYGLLARTVLNKWHIESTEDFGKIVYALVEAEEMRKSEGDSIDDFNNVFDFDEAFGDMQMRP
jgi:uncharacterized repeat protein (TIGR04138 family)